MTPPDPDPLPATLAHLQARRRAVLDMLKAWPTGMVGMEAWRAKMRELREINREMDRVLEGLED